MIDELIDLLKQTSSPKKIRQILEQYPPYDIAKCLEYLTDDELRRISKAFTPEEIGVVVSYLDVEDASEFLGLLPKDRIIAILNEMEADDVMDILEEVDDTKAEAITKELDTELQAELEIIDGYEEGTAGALMNPNFIKVKESLSVKQAMSELIKNAADVEFIDPLFVVDDTDKLIGVLDLKELICARMPKKVSDVMLENFAYVNTTDTNDDVVRVVKDYDLKAVPVLEDGIIKGVITMDDAFDALTDEAEEDYAKLAGLTEDVEEDEKIFDNVKKRIPWLAILLVLDIVIAIVISRFDAVIESLTILTFFQAAVLGLAGNCGTQALAVCVRKIASGEIDEKKALRRHIGRELLQGLGTAICLGILSFIFVVIMLLIKKTPEGTEYVLRVGTVLGVAVLTSVILSNVFGTLLPIFFYKIKVDPAVASGPFITTINDIVAVVVYYGTALLIMSAYL